MSIFLAQIFNAQGVLTQEFKIEDPLNEGAEFYAHQLLHIDGVACVEIFKEVNLHGELGWSTVIRRCDEGVDFEETVVVTAQDQK